MREEMKRNTICALTGITQETLRFYVEEGLISPKTDQSNHYRYYSMDDALLILSVRNFRNYGMSIQEVSELLRGDLDENAIEKTNEMIERQLLAEKEALEVKISFLRQVRAYQRFDRGVCIVTGLDVMYAAFFDGTQESIDLVKMMQEHMPPATVALRFRKNGGWDVGLAIAERYMHQIPDQWIDQLMYLGSSRILHYRKFSRLSEVSYREVQDVIDYAEKHRFKPTSDIFLVPNQVRVIGGNIVVEGNYGVCCDIFDRSVL